VASYDAMDCQGKPVLELLSIGMIYGESTTIPLSESMVCVDIEEYPIDIRIDSTADVEAGARFYINHITALKNSAPDILFGYYGIGPLRDYWSPVSGLAEDIALWQAANEAISGVFDAQDILFPSIYTFYDDQEGWRKYASANIAEARRIAKGKPIFPFVWNAFHPSTVLAGTALDYDYFYMELNYLKSLGVNGIVLWNSPVEQWSEDAGWCRAIRQFITDQS